MKHLFLLLVASLFLTDCQTKKDSSNVVQTKPVDNSVYLLVGSYSNGQTAGISVYDFDQHTADFKPVSEIYNILNPSWLVVSPDKKMVYAVNETSKGDVTSFRFDKATGTLDFINSQATGGGDPCYINIDNSQHMILTANYSGGNISVFPLSDNGKIRPASQIINFNGAHDRKTSHIHTVVFSPDQKYVFATDLGKGRITRFRVDMHDIHKHYLKKDGASITLERGSGPRHIDFHPKKDLAYCINELSGIVTVFQYCTEKRLTLVQRIASDTSHDHKKKGSADIHVSPDGKFLYTSNRLNNDGIAIFSIDTNTGRLTPAGYQKTGIHPRNFIISPNGKYLLCANRDSNTIQIFVVNHQTGLLTDTGKEIRLDRPVCLKWISK